MPTYEYHCRKCGRYFEMVMTLREHEEQKRKKRKPACPHCRSRSVEQRPSVFQAVTSTKG